MKMSLTLAFILILCSFSALASNVNVTVVKSCPDGLEIQRFDVWGNAGIKTRFFITLNGTSLESLNEQLDLETNLPLERFEVTSEKWGEFNGRIAKNQITLSEINEGRSVMLKIANTQGSEMANYFFNRCQ